MRVIKLGGRVVGGDLTAAEKKAMDIEMRKAFAEYDRKHAREFDAIVLWTLHVTRGYGPKRLREVYDSISEAIDNLIEFYEFEGSDFVWLCTTLLKEYGIDLEEWEKERKNNY